MSEGVAGRRVNVRGHRGRGAVGRWALALAALAVLSWLMAAAHAAQAQATATGHYGPATIPFGPYQPLKSIGGIERSPQSQSSDAMDAFTKANVWIEGVDSNDLVGYEVSGAGDVNGDGRDDVIVGAPFAHGGWYGKGAAYVVFGQTRSGKVDLAALGEDGFEITGAASLDWAGYAVSGAGDVNADGLADVIVAAPSASNNDRLGSGSAYVVFGRKSTARVDLATFDDSSITPSHGFRIDGAEPGDWAGYSVSGGGDVNGDGRSDVIVGAATADNRGRSNAGSAYVVFGKRSVTRVDLRSDREAGYRIDGAARNDSAGDRVSDAGDVNGDGLADVILSAPWADSSGRQDSGSAYVVFGKAGNEPIDLRSDTDATIRLYGGQAWSMVGFGGVSGAGDVNGDGLADVILDGGWERTKHPDYPFAQTAYVLFGRTAPGIIDLGALRRGGFPMHVLGQYATFVGSVAGAGDLNGDGLGDVLVASPRLGHQGKEESGTVFPVSGKTSATPVYLGGECEDRLHFDGVAEYDEAGWSVDGAGDTNGDGRPDVIVGAIQAYNENWEWSGAAYIGTAPDWPGQGPDC